MLTKNAFKKLVKQCIAEVLTEEEPLYVEYHSQRAGEEPFMMGGTKFEYVNAKYPDGRIDIGVYSFAEDLVYSYNVFRKRMGIKEEGQPEPYDPETDTFAPGPRDRTEPVKKPSPQSPKDSKENG